MNKKTKELIANCVADLIDSKVAINLPMEKKVVFSDGDEQLKSNGYFSEDPKEFAVAMKKPQKDWLPIFLHEYSHFRQWKEKSPVWTESDFNIMDAWLGGTDFSDSSVNKSITALRNLELDCEIRTVKLIQDSGIKLDVERYIKMSNAYILFYNIVRLKRVWYKVAPYEVKEILDIMPSTFMSDFRETPKEYYGLVVEHCL